MKYAKWLLVLAFSSSLVWAGQDIVLKTRFDLKSSESFINELRKFLIHNDFGDPYAQEITKPVSIDLATVLDDIPADTQRWIRELQSVLRFDLFESDYQLKIDGLSYRIQDFNTEFRPGRGTGERVDFVTTNYVRGLQLEANKITFEVLLKQTQSREPIKFKIELINPEFIVSPELTAELPMGWMTTILPDSLLISLMNVNIEKVMQKVCNRPELIDLRIADMKMPNVSIRIGKKEVKFDQKKIKHFFLVRKNEMKSGILDILNARFKDKFRNIISDKPKEITVPRSFGFSSDISGVFDIQRMNVNRTGILELNLDGNFCEAQDFEASLCKDLKSRTKIRRVIDEATYQKSLREINRSLIEKSSNIAFSVSEDFLNQVVDATVSAGLWDETLKDSKFILGPEKAFVLADEKGQTFSLYLDIIYKLTKGERILVGRSELRFPVKFKIGLNIEEKDGYPHFIIAVKEIDTDNKLLIEGAPEFQLPSNVKGVRFRNKVLKEIMAEVNLYQDEILLDFEVKELKGTYLHQLEFFSDGLGRGTATLGFSK